VVGAITVVKISFNKTSLLAAETNMWWQKLSYLKKISHNSFTILTDMKFNKAVLKHGHAGQLPGGTTSIGAPY
jgi:hypothetical protein